MPWPYAIVACSIGFHVFAGRSRPATSPGKPVFGGVPKPASESVCHMRLRRQRQRDLRRADVRRLLDHLLDGERARADARRGSSWRRSSACRAPVWITRVGAHRAGLERGGDRERLQRRARLEHVGQRAVAHAVARDACRARSGCTSASSRARGSRRCCASRMTRPPAFALCCSTAAFSSRNARYCRRESIESARSRPACGARIAATSSTTSPRRLMITRRLPGTPREPRLLRELDAFLAGVAVAGEADDVAVTSPPG